jgi:hypothetical protein
MSIDTRLDIEGERGRYDITIDDCVSGSIVGLPGKTADGAGPYIIGLRGQGRSQLVSLRDGSIQNLPGYTTVWPLRFKLVPLGCCEGRGDSVAEDSGGE